MAGPTVFTLTSVVALSQQWNLPLAFCELGDGLYDNEDPTLTWLPNLVGYLKQIDRVAAGAHRIHESLGHPVDRVDPAPGDPSRRSRTWKAALGTSGSLMTVPVP